MAGEACMDIKLIGKVTVRQKLQVLSLYTLTYTNAIYTYIYVIKACQGIMWRLTLLGWKMTFLPLMDEVRAVPHIPLAIHGVLLKSINLSGVHCSALILYPEKILVSNLSSCFLLWGLLCKSLSCSVFLVQLENKLLKVLVWSPG